MKILVSSCDRYADLWPAFFHLLFKYWPDCPKPVYLISNQKTYQDDRVVSLLFPNDEGWAVNLRGSLEQIDSDYVVYLQEDYLFHAPVPQEKIVALRDFIRNAGGPMLQLKVRGTDSNQEQAGSTAEVIHFATTCRWMTTLQAAIWNRRAMLDIIAPEWNPWQAESGVNRHAKKVGSGFYGIRAGQENVFPYTEGVKGGYWMPAGITVCRREGIEPDLRTRPWLPQGPSFLKKIIRSVIKRKTEFLRKFRAPDTSTIVLPLTSK